MPLMLEFLHLLDRHADSMEGLPAPMKHPLKQQRYALMMRRVEAWSSASRDGFNAPRDEALGMLETERLAENEIEEAIWQRYRLMTAIDNEAGKPVSTDRIRYFGELVEAELTDDQAGHLCALINGTLPGYFLHPLLRAITTYEEVDEAHADSPSVNALHRALFYKVMLDHRYPVFRFLALSEQANCFTREPPPACEEEGVQRILRFMRGIDEALEAARRWVAEDQEKHVLPDNMAAQTNDLNHRQRILLAQSLANPASVFTMDSHRREHGVAYATARADLYALRDAGLLRATKKGKAWVFTPVSAGTPPQNTRPIKPVAGSSKSAPPPQPDMDAENSEKERRVQAPRANPERSWYFW